MEQAEHELDEDEVGLLARVPDPRSRHGRRYPLPTLLGIAVAVDGQTVRGALDADGQRPHLLAALVHGHGTVVVQQRVAAKPTRSRTSSRCWTTST